jgi:hypothetical protein
MQQGERGCYKQAVPGTGLFGKTQYVEASSRRFGLPQKIKLKNLREILAWITRGRIECTRNSLWFSKMTTREERHPLSRATVTIPIDGETVRTAERHISSCENCAPDLAEVPFDFIFDRVTGCDPRTTNYQLALPAACPCCGSVVQTGYWKWEQSEVHGHRVFILPGTLVTLKE